MQRYEKIDCWELFSRNSLFFQHVICCTLSIFPTRFAEFCPFFQHVLLNFVRFSNTVLPNFVRFSNMPMYKLSFPEIG